MMVIFLVQDVPQQVIDYIEEKLLNFHLMNMKIL